ncbi:MAG: twin transmembrane helix small protein [Azospirillaceae bacterium]
MNTVFFILAIASGIATLVILGVGLVGMAGAGEFNRKYGNRLMRWRVMMQAATIGFAALAFLTR